MEELKEIREKLYKQTRKQKEEAWIEKDFKKSIRIREEEKANYQKWKFLDSLLKANERIKEDEKD